MTTSLPTPSPTTRTSRTCQSVADRGKVPVAGAAEERLLAEAAANLMQAAGIA
ncbi:MAG: hypothetical protein L3J36_11670 [Rhodobacteraceae bacterium]|nr:hypothetical protein [Paracoccaceae bacterium]